MPSFTSLQNREKSASLGSEAELNLFIFALSFETTEKMYAAKVYFLFSILYNETPACSVIVHAVIGLIFEDVSMNQRKARCHANEW